MDQSAQKRLCKEKNVKAKLVQTRKVIQSKFQKAYKGRIQNERKLKEKYRPITSAIEKLHEQKGKKLAVPSIEKQSKRTTYPVVRGFDKRSGGGDSDDSSKPDDWNDRDTWQVSGSSNTFGNLKNAENWDEESLPSDDDDERVWDTDIDDISARKKLHTSHHVSHKLPGLQFLHEYDDADGAGPSHASTFEPMDYEEERMKRRNAEKSGVGPGKRIRLSKPLVDKNSLAKNRPKWQVRNIMKAREIRKSALQRAIAAAKERPLPQIESDNESSSASTVYDLSHDNRVSHVVDLVSSDGEEGEEEGETVQQSSLRTTEKRRKPQELHRNKKLFKVPTVGNIDRKLLAKYGKTQRLPKKLLQKYRQRSFPSQQNPFNLEPPIPSISNPYLTKEQILYRGVNPPEPENMPVLDAPVKKNKKKKKKDDATTGSGIETEFIPYNENVAYEFYDNPNELCDRLRLLIASKAAGNTNHVQEINSLISELRESGYIN